MDYVNEEIGVAALGCSELVNCKEERFYTYIRSRLIVILDPTGHFSSTAHYPLATFCGP